MLSWTQISLLFYVFINTAMPFQRLPTSAAVTSSRALPFKEHALRCDDAVPMKPCFYGEWGRQRAPETVRQYALQLRGGGRRYMFTHFVETLHLSVLVKSVSEEDRGTTEPP